jgi:hypothetical protein
LNIHGGFRVGTPGNIQKAIDASLDGKDFGTVGIQLARLGLGSVLKGGSQQRQHGIKARVAQHLVKQLQQRCLRWLAGRPQGFHQFQVVL